MAPSYRARYDGAMRALAVLPALAVLASVPAAEASLPAAAVAPTHATLSWDGAPVHTLVVPAGARVRPVARRPGRTVPAWRAATGAIAAINGGYFNHSDGWPVSHVVVDGEALTAPHENKALRANPVLAPHLPRIFGRRTTWIDTPDGWRLAPWNAKPAGWRAALQAGPALLPEIGLEAEAFVIRGKGGAIARDGIASGARAPRSALGLRPDGAMVWAVVGSPGLAIPQLATLMARLGCDRAMGLDGGGSSTLVWTENGRPRVYVGGGGAAALVNSALVVEP